MEGHLPRRNSLLVLLYDPEIKFHCVQAYIGVYTRVCVCVHGERGTWENLGWDTLQSFMALTHVARWDSAGTEQV